MQIFSPTLWPASLLSLQRSFDELMFLILIQIYQSFLLGLSVLWSSVKSSFLSPNQKVFFCIFLTFKIFWFSKKKFFFDFHIKSHIKSIWKWFLCMHPDIQIFPICITSCFLTSYWTAPSSHMICSATSGVYKNPIYTLFSWSDESIPAPILLHLFTGALMLFLTSGPLVDAPAPTIPGMSSLFLPLYR